MSPTHGADAHEGHKSGGPGHEGHDHGGSASERRLRLALALLFGFTVIEAIGGFWANSIALLAESAHMLADSASLLLAIVAIRVGRAPASAQRTYGSQRYQTLAAYTNGITLLALTIWIMVEAARRLIAPPQVNGPVMLGIALVGGVANVAAFLVLSGASSLNERGARAHVLSDLLGSGAATVAAGIILLFGWLTADPLLSIAVSFLILRSGWRLTREAAQVLLEGAPTGVNAGQVEACLKEVHGVAQIHHVHVWSLTGETPMVTLHARLDPDANRDVSLAAILTRLRERLGVEHATVQIEVGPCAELCAPVACLVVPGAKTLT